MLIVTINEIPGKKLEALGVVRGSTVQSRNLGHDMMAGFRPLLAVLLVQKAFLRQPTGIGWKVQGKRRFWLAAWFGPAMLTLLGAVLYFAVFPSRLDFSCSWLVAAYGGEMDAQTLRSELGVSTLSYLLQNGLFAVLLAPAINMFPALGEEVGWRGYMMPRLKEQFGLLNGRLLGGVVWGIWHWPLMLLVGYEYGTNYLGAPLLGLVVWCVVCFALNPRPMAGSGHRKP